MPGPPESDRETGARGNADRSSAQRATDPGDAPAERRRQGRAGKQSAPRPPARKGGSGGRPGAPALLMAPDEPCRAFMTIDPEESDLAAGRAVHRVIREQLRFEFV